MLPLKTKENFKQICQCKHFPVLWIKTTNISILTLPSTGFRFAIYHLSICDLYAFAQHFPHFSHSFQLEVFFVASAHTHTYACIYNRRTIFSRWLLFGLPFLSVNITTQIHFICRNLLAFIFGPRKPNENHFLVRRLAEKLFGEKFFSYAFSFSFSFVHIYLHTSVKSFCLLLASTFCSNFNNRTELLTLIKLKPKWKLQFIWHAKSCLLRHYHPSHRHRMLRSFAREMTKHNVYIEGKKTCLEQLDSKTKWRNVQNMCVWMWMSWVWKWFFFAVRKPRNFSPLSFIFVRFVFSGLKITSQHVCHWTALNFSHWQQQSNI